MDVVDAQVHLNMLGIEQGLALMDEIGVTAAIIDEYISPNPHRLPQPGSVVDGVFRWAQPLSSRAVAAYPGRFAYITRCEPHDPELPSLIASLRRHPGLLALRLHPEQHAERALAALVHKIKSGVYDRYFSCAQEHGVPVFLQLSGVNLPGERGVVTELAQAYPDLELILDHMTVSLPDRHDRLRPSRFAEFDELLKLATYQNLSLKWCHMPRLSASGFPYADVAVQLYRVVEAFGSNRIMWASDCTIDLEWNSWRQALDFIRADPQLTPSEKADILGKTARRVLDWPAHS